MKIHIEIKERMRMPRLGLAMLEKFRLKARDNNRKGADRAGLNEQYFNQIMSGNKPMTLIKAQEIAKGYGYEAELTLTFKKI